MMIKVSVIIPVYQVEAYIEECLDSVTMQTLRELEIICIHDGGTDRSFALVKEAAEKDPRIRMVENEHNIGLASTRNRGLELAQGSYVYFLDSDDKILPGALEQLYDQAEQEKLEVQIFGSSFIYESPELEERFYQNPSRFKQEYPFVMSGRDLYVEWMRVWDWLPSQPRYFYSRSFLKEHGLHFMDGMLHEDETFAFDVLMHAKRVRVTNDAFFIRRFRADSIMTGSVTMHNVESCIRILRHVWEVRNDYPEDQELWGAVQFYMGKITNNARGKYQSALDQGEEGTRPKVSVIIPVYNVEPYLEACLNSVLAQTLWNLEVICVEDASTDRSLAILREYEQLDPRIRVLTHDQNKGQSCGRNLGLSEAVGEFVYMLDADDLITKDALEQLYESGSREQLDVIGFENRQFTDDPAFEEVAGKPLFDYKGFEGVYSGRDAFICCVMEDLLSPSVPTFLIRNEYLKAAGIRFVEGIFHEDIGFILELLTRAGRVRLMSRKLFLRRFRANSTVTSGFSARHAEGYLRSFLKSFELEPVLKARYGQDPEFWEAFHKWQRDVISRIRQLCSEDGSLAFEESCGSAGERVRQALKLLALVTPTRSQTERRLGSELCRRLEAGKQEITEESPSCYVCGTGQYANRALDLIGTLNMIVKGILVLDKDRTAYRGFPVLRAEEAADKTLPVLLTVSRYQTGAYTAALSEAGFRNLITLPGL